MEKRLRVTEGMVQGEILKCLSDGKVWTNAALKKELRKQLPLSPADKARANKRNAEEKWHELVNNALAPSRSNSLPAKGYTTSEGIGRHAITEAGRRRLEDQDEIDALLESLIDKVEAGS